MLTLGLRYLCGRSTATDPTDRASAEWPPHPGRVYMALASAYFEGPQREEERKALETLESLPPPEIHAPRAGVRAPVTQFVPVNDTVDPKLGLPMGSMPLGRNRQPRTTPSVPLELDAEVRIVWPDANLDEGLVTALSDLCARVSRVGHSSSLVQMYLRGNGPESAWEGGCWCPDEDQPEAEFRVAGAGRLSELEASYSHGLRPAPGLWSGYRFGGKTKSALGATVFDPDLVILRIVRGPKIDLVSTLKIATALRGAVMSQATDPPPEVISGHRPDGSPSERPHLAFAPLAHVNHEHADGTVLGMAIILPRDISQSERKRCMAAIGGSRRRDDGTVYLPLYLGSVAGRPLEWELEPETREQPPRTLIDSTWTRPSTIWASVTPVALDRYTDDEQAQQEVVSNSCRRIGLPAPAEVRVSAVSWLTGAPSAPEMPPLSKGRRGPRRFHLHVWLKFDKPVRGPILIGAGRYRGYGLCRQMQTRGGGSHAQA